MQGTVGEQRHIPTPLLDPGLGASDVPGLCQGTTSLCRHGRALADPWHGFFPR